MSGFTAVTAEVSAAIGAPVTNARPCLSVPPDGAAAPIRVSALTTTVPDTDVEAAPLTLKIRAPAGNVAAACASALPLWAAPVAVAIATPAPPGPAPPVALALAITE